MATEKLSNSLVEYLQAIKNEKYDDAVKILTNIINHTPVQEKDKLVICLKYRICALYALEQYEMIVKDCSKLDQLGVSIDDDVEVSMIKAESLVRFYTESAAEIFDHLSLKYKVKRAQTLANRLHTINLKKLFSQDATLSRQNSFKK